MGLAGVGVILPEQTGAATTTNSRGEVVTDSALADLQAFRAITP